MDVMVVGGGGREHALIESLRKSPQVSKVYALPGNGGIADVAECVPIAATDIEGIVRFAQDAQVDFAVVAPDDPLVLGAVDALEAAGIPTFGPNAKAALIEGSKAFAKDLMLRYGIPTADYRVFTDLTDALDYLRDAHYPLVVKADGLALGKGVVIAPTEQEAAEAATSMLSGDRFGQAGKRIVVEEYLVGPEVTVLTFTDGSTVVPMVSSMDHKRIFNGDLGPNTGGMGVIAPNPFYTEDIAQVCSASIIQPTIEAMRKEGRPFKGCLYFGLILTEQGPKVIEYNCRFGDPETQAILPLLESDLFTILRAVRAGELDQVDVNFSDRSSCCVVLASEGYPGQCQVGRAIELPLAGNRDTHLYHAGTVRHDNAVLTSGGRVLAVTALGDNLEDAIDAAYLAVQDIRFEGAQYRTDIGATALSIPAK